MKVTAHTNGLIYNTNGKGDQYRVALRSGIWPSGCDLHLNVGPNSLIIGAGGDGGNGGSGGGKVRVVRMDLLLLVFLLH